MNERMKALLAQIAAIQTTAKGFMTGETKEVEKASTELAKVDGLQKEYNVEKALYEAEKGKVPDVIPPTEKTLTDEQKEEKSFSDYIKGEKTEKVLSQGANGAVIPTTIANKIIEDVKDLSPIYNMATKYYTSGTLEIPFYGADGGSEISAAYQGAEFTALTAAQGKYTAVELKGYSIGSLALISKKFIGNTDINVTSFARAKIAQAFADKFEKELLIGAGGGTAMTGATSTTNLVTLTTKTLAGITLDFLIDLQLKVKKIYQKNASWIMSEDVFAAVRKIKDLDGKYVMTNDITTGFEYMLLGKVVYTSENMPSVGASSVPVLYGDFSGMAMKIAKDVEIQLLTETYAAQNAIGIVGWVEADSKIENLQKFAGLKMSV